MIGSSVVIHYLDFVGIAIVPLKANPVLIVDSNAMLTAPVTCQSLQPITRWNPQVVGVLRVIEYHQLSLRLSLYMGGELPNGASFRDCSGVPVFESLDHFLIIVSHTNSAWRN